MSKQEYLKALNFEIQKLNGIIDRKIIQDADYRREARRHRHLLAQLRKEEARRSLFRVFRLFFPSFR
jgi:hypothetical protein